MALRQKLAVVTGGGSGIGRAIAHRFALEGATCVLVGRDPTKLQDAVRNLLPPVKPWDGPSPGPRDGSNAAFFAPETHHYAFSGNVQDSRFWNKLRLEFKQLDILVNAAGVAQNSLLVRTKITDIEDIINTNLVGTTLGCREASSMMIRQGVNSRPADKFKEAGCIINVSSVLANKQGAGAAVYAASKAGVLGLTRSLAVELGKYKIRVNALVPGYINTPMTNSKSSKLGQTVIDSIPLGRMGSTKEVADAALFLATNSYAHGCILNLDGGLSAV
ncbi:hypothetical protein MGG_06734 [Pyricularia oryzae 70-15]|uniref:3-oxoacyl-[acyl-carrier-protein] reductase n=3 Tax=Pyricularia oryzae TaxID=318829 RepID=G4MLK3_PYRO7|nr:uncharacterized protein MGG_06734 [Pyricularia oryzae 70-15]EHA56836.1 hypothetical protein MGG_06734 [Pyricularia oryzae 70-15]KAI7927775.1 hypothetical protein M9X92_002143 [Pyricularia oryzae]KAI7929097.1 hypothetical protein M0657_002355 [Pyricularia oryzae]